MNKRFVTLALLVALGLWGVISLLSPTRSTVISQWPGSNRPGSISGQAVPAVRGTAALPANNPAISTQLDAYMTNLANVGQWSGAVLVARRGTVMLAKGYGFANATQRVANTDTTRFRLASMTKQFTSMAVMQLASTGKIDLDASICQYLPNCPAAWQPILIRHVLTHTSGLPNYTDFGSYEATMAQPTTPTELIGRIRDQPLLATPGTVYRYGNSGYVVLGAIIEQVSGQSYGDYLHDHIFAPLGMNDSGYDVGSNNLAQGYVTLGVPCSRLDATTLFSAGGLYSSVEDLYRWDQALYSSALLPDSQRAQIFTPQAGSYGFGWIITQYHGQRIVEHPGLMSGAATYIARMPDAGVTVIVLSNLETAAVDQIAHRLADLVLDS